jgi:hypothetical protein
LKEEGGKGKILKPEEVALELLKLAKTQEDKNRIRNLIESFELGNGKKSMTSATDYDHGPSRC